MTFRSFGLRFAFMMLLGAVCYPQGRPLPRTQRPVPPRAPYMLRVKSLEESQYVTKVVAKNGMTVVVNEFRANPVVDVMAYIRAGYADEPEDLPGISAVLGRMIFRATPNRPAGTAAKDLQALGATLTTTTSYNHTSYDIVVPSASWKRALEIQSDALLNAVFDPDEVGRQAALAAAGTEADLSDPQAGPIARLLRLGFTENRVQPFLPGGAKPRISADRLLTFYKAKYDPSRITLVVAGDVIATEVLNEATRLYETAKPGAARTIVQDRPRTGFQYQQYRSDLSFPSISIGFHAPSSTSEDYPAFEVLRTILGTGEASILARRLVRQKKLAMHVRTDYVAYPDLGYLVVQLEADPKDIDRCELAALTEVELLKHDTPDAGAMERAFAQLERRYWTGLQSVLGRAHLLARFEEQGSWRGMNGYISRLRQVKAADVNRVAEKYLELENFSLVELLPAGGEPRKYTAETALRTFQQLLGPSAEQEGAEREKETVAAIDIPGPANPNDFRFSEVRNPFQTASVLRGPDLIIREDHTSPTIQLGFLFAGGRLSETPQNWGITELTVRSMLRSTATKNAEQIHRQLEIYGGEITPVVSDDFFGFYVSVLSRNIDKALDLIGDMVRTPKFDEDEISWQRQLQLCEIKDAKAWDVAYPEELARQALFKDHPYGAAAHGSESSVAKLDQNAVRAWYSDHVRNRKPLIVIVGDTQGTSLAAYFVKNFSGARFQDVKLPDLTPKSPEQKLAVDQDWARYEAFAAIALQAPPLGDEDVFPVEVLRAYLAGTGGRLDEEIAKRQALSFDLSMSYEPRVRGGSLLIRAAVPPGNEQPVERVLQEELRKVSENQISYRDYRSSVNAAIAACWVTRQSRFSEISTAAENILAGQGIAGYQQYPDLLQDVKQEDVAEVARRVLNLDKSVTVRVHGQPEK
jgi:zinc protease